MGFCAGVQPPVPPIAGAGHALARALRSPDSTGRVRSRNSVEPGRRWTNNRDDQSRGNLGGPTRSVWSGDDHSDQRTHWKQRRRDRPTTFLSRRSLPAQPGPPIIRRKAVKQTGAFLLFMMLAGVARLDAHAFLQQAKPGVGSTV